MNPYSHTKLTLEFVQRSLQSALEAPEPFGGVAFNPDATDSAVTNGDRANAGRLSLALYCATADPMGPLSVLEDIADEVSLMESPEDALCDLLIALMHYCHREGIEFYGEDGVLPRAQRHFAKESRGAAL